MSNYKKYGIYGIQNTINNKAYIGKTTTNFGDRWDSHRALLRANKHSNKNLQKDWNEYGENNFEFIIVHDLSGECLETVNEYEINEIAKYKKLNLAYNLHDGGDIGYYKGKHLTEEVKRKIGQKNRINMTGKKATEETKQKMSKSQKERFSKWSDDDRKNWSEYIKSKKVNSKKWNDDQKAKLKGNKNGATLDLKTVLEIRRLHEQEKMGYTEISNILKINRQTVYNIATYRRWNDIPSYMYDNPVPSK